MGTLFARSTFLYFLLFLDLDFFKRCLSDAPDLIGF